jgi:hypothetical protein
MTSKERVLAANTAGWIERRSIWAAPPQTAVVADAHAR